MNKKYIYILALLSLLYFVFIDEVSNTYIINSSSKIINSSSWISENTIFCLLLILQIIFSPLQAGFSDYFVRKKSLIISISITLASVILLKLSSKHGVSFLLIAVIIKGVFGNTLPIAWAGIADESNGKNIRFLIALSIFALAIGSWGSLLLIPRIAPGIFSYVILGILIAGAVIVTTIFSDPADSPSKSDENYADKLQLKKTSILTLIIQECLGLYRIGRKPLNLLALISFFFSEISFYQILLRIEVFDNYPCFMSSPLAIGIGYTAGTVLLKFLKGKNRHVSATGLSLSSISILIITIFFYIGIQNKNIFTLFFSFYSFGYALFTPSLFAIVSSQEALHNQGKCYGLIDSFESFATLCTFIILFLTRRISCTLSLNISLHLIVISAIIFLIVFIKARAYEK